jgi:hypothetical protein
MKHASLMTCLIVLALAGCDKASEPVSKVERQDERKEQQGMVPLRTLWSPEFKDQTLKECAQRAAADMNSKGVLKCRCVIEKASATIPEQRFKAIQTDPAVKDMIRQIGAAC